MSYLIFILAGLAILIGLALFVVDIRKKKTAEEVISAPAAAVAEPDSDVDEVQLKSVESPEPEDSPEPEPEPATGGFSILTTQRKERRTWAEAHGWEFARSDPYLDDEWSRGAAATGAAPKDIVRGAAYGYEMYLANLGTTPVMAMRREEASEVVVDFRRSGVVVPSSSDLLEVTSECGFDLYATEAGIAERMVDQRVRHALAAFPDTLHAVWMESDWVIAELERGCHQDTWDAVIEPLALITDAAHALPPRGPAGAPPLYPDDHPSRTLPSAPTPEEDYNPAEPDITATPLVIRPEEPLDMPTRSHAESRGVVEHRDLGGDEINPIAEGEAAQPNDHDGVRVVRDLSRKSTIFDDLKEKFGHDPLADWPEDEEDYSKDHGSK